MRIPRFYSQIELAVDNVVCLNEKAAHHAVNVLRMTVNDPVILFDGHGGEYCGHIIQAGKRSVEVKLQSFDSRDRESPLRTELAIGLSKGDRMDWVLQKATELGVSSIVPLFSERTEVKLSQDRRPKRMEHWRQVCINACEQSQRTQLPTLSDPKLFSEYVDYCQTERKLIFHYRNQTEPLHDKNSPGSVALLVGPEGGFSDQEISKALAAGFSMQALGPRTLRTETAPVAALTLVQYLWGDFKRTSGPNTE